MSCSVAIDKVMFMWDESWAAGRCGLLVALEAQLPPYSMPHRR